MKIYTLLFVFLIFASCKNNYAIQKKITSYIQKSVRSTSKFKVLDIYSIDSMGLRTNGYAKSHNNFFIFSATNKAGYEITREIWYEADKDLNIQNTFPKNIDVENGNLKGTISLNLSNIFNHSKSYILSNAAITLINFDTLITKRVYETVTNNTGKYEFTDIVPGNYFLKITPEKLKYNQLFKSYDGICFANLMGIKSLSSSLSIYVMGRDILKAYPIRDINTLLQIDKQMDSCVDLAVNGGDKEILFNQVIANWEKYKKNLPPQMWLDFKLHDDISIPMKFEKLEVLPNQNTEKNFAIDIN